MPNAVVKSYAEKSGKSPEEIEKWWKEAEEESKKKFPKKGPHYWAYVNGIVKKRAKIKENVGFKDWLEVLNEETVVEALTFQQVLAKLDVDAMDLELFGNDAGEDSTVREVVKDSAGEKWLLTRTGKYQAYKYTLKKPTNK